LSSKSSNPFWHDGRAIQCNLAGGMCRSFSLNPSGDFMGLISFLFGDGYRPRTQRDQWRPSVIGKTLISPINDYGTCFPCEGSGTRTLQCGACDGSGTHTGECRGCQGTGRFELPAKPCFTCEGLDSSSENPASNAGGTGDFKPAISQSCKKCDGTGKFSAVCRKCSGSGCFPVTCKRCGGSGWHKFKR